MLLGNVRPLSHESCRPGVEDGRVTPGASDWVWCHTPHPAPGVLHRGRGGATHGETKRTVSGQVSVLRTCPYKTTSNEETVHPTHES